jgi:hypothetical protein
MMLCGWNIRLPDRALGLVAKLWPATEQELTHGHVHGATGTSTRTFFHILWPANNGFALLSEGLRRPRLVAWVAVRATSEPLDRLGYGFHRRQSVHSFSTGV